jgi:ABC-type dipeptide/oligopeptide/nickel transport system permease component
MKLTIPFFTVSFGLLAGCTFFAVSLGLLAGCSTGSVGTGTVFHTVNGQSYAAASSPTFTHGQYEFVDSKGGAQSLSLAQITHVSQR